MNLSIVGTGYVGLVSGTCFAEIGHKVTCIDIDEKKVAMLKDGISPIYEPGLEELIEQNLKANRLNFATDFDSVIGADAIFIAVGTPSQADGSANLDYVYSAIDMALDKISNNAIFVIKSTVPIGTAKKVKKYIAQKTDKDFFVVNNPEFLKEGSAVQDFMRPDRIVIGAKEEEAARKVSRMYEPFFRQGYRIYTMSNLSAEMTKYAANCFLATKVSFINEVAKLCDATGADIDEVRQGIMSDPRIGSKFLYPGPGYGGSCFPKDVNALIRTGNQHDSPLKIIESVHGVNEAQREYVFQKIAKHFGGDLKDKKIAFWGVAFKANTDDIRESSAIRISELLVEAGAKVTIYDQEASQNFKEFMKTKGISIEVAESKYDCADHSDAVIILTEWKEFHMPDFDRLKNVVRSPAIFDMRNLYKPKEIIEKGFKYYSIGRMVE